jgi:hypothetical protein
MRTTPRRRKAHHYRPPRPDAAARFRECIRLLDADLNPTREELERIERIAQQAPYYRPQLELPV